MQVNHGYKGVNARVEVRATTGSTPILRLMYTIIRSTCDSLRRGG
jgi:hypothetical protein